jgi:hypothetical protein
VSPPRPAPAPLRIRAAVFFFILAAAALAFLVMKASRAPASQMSFVEVREGSAVGALTVLDRGRPVLTYVHGDRLPEGLGPEQARSCYIHPLYSLDGEVLTEDFPADHLHHHGLFWAWPAVEVRGALTQSWHPAEPALRQRFVRWVEREVTDAGARFTVENAWRLGGAEDVAVETVAVRVHGASRFGRAIDIEIAVKPVGGSLTLRGAAEENKGYGGLCFRGRAFGPAGEPLFKGAAMTTDEGPLEADSAGRPFLWADLSTPKGGVAVFVSPDHPGFPLPWLVRNSYAGIIDPCWPGLDTASLKADVPVFLRYRVYVHRRDARSGRVGQAYAAYAAVRGL